MALCEHCKKRKVGIIAFNCKCSYKVLCSKCRLPEQHECTYDHKVEERKRLEEANPIVVGDKMERI
jgi:hypothetical protein